MIPEPSTSESGARRNRVIEAVPRNLYEHNEIVARRRVRRDPHDWAPVALALTLNASILTGDHDYLGCGVPTWTTETLRTELDA
jgi:predicted nucleic acid-binding protein